MTMLDVTDVTKTYGDVTALEDLSLSVEAGTTAGLLGTNGAGKTTLFKLLVGHVRPDSGRLTVAGTDVTDAGTAVRRTVGYLPERASFPASLTAREVLRFHARVRGLPRAERPDRVETVLDRVGLADAADRRVDGYSNGMHRRLGLATALLARPRVLLLDEPTAGLDPLGVAAFHDVLADLRRDGDLTVVLSSHVLGEVESLCEEVAVLHDGRLRAAGPVDDLRRGADGGVTLRLDLADPDDADRAAAVLRDRGGEVRSHEGGTVTAAVPRAGAVDLLVALDEAVGLAGFEVREPGLSAVFRDAVGEVSEP